LRRVNTTAAHALALVVERLIYRPARVRRLAAVSNGVLKELHAHYPRVPTRVAPNGVDIERFRPNPETRRDTRTDEDIGADDVVALFVGGDWDHKGLAVAIRALARATGDTAAGLWLWVVGKGDARRFRAVARQHGVEKRVRFFGARTDPERFYQAADVFVLPTLYETFSLAAFEAAASGLPVVAPRVSGIDELIGDDEAGIVVERSSEVVAAALSRLAADPDLRKHMGDEARRRASLYTWEHSVDSMLALYRELLGEPVTVNA
jgi:UDP-glucose:(heptosyl)LPS alpha-1,3-glucosyltransferase